MITATLWGCSYWTQEHVGETQLRPGVIELLDFSALGCARPASSGAAPPVFRLHESADILHPGQTTFMKGNQIDQLLAGMLCCVLG